LKYKLGNKGPNTAQNVVIYVPLPEGLNYVGAQVDTGSVSYNANNRMLTWILDSVPMGDPYLNLTVISTAGGSFTIRPVISSGTFNANLDPTGIFSFNVQGNGSNKRCQHHQNRAHEEYRNTSELPGTGCFDGDKWVNCT